MLRLLVPFTEFLEAFTGLESIDSPIVLEMRTALDSALQDPKKTDIRGAFPAWLLQRHVPLVLAGAPALAVFLETAFQHNVSLDGSIFHATLRAQSAHPLAVLIAAQRVRWQAIDDTELRAHIADALAMRIGLWEMRGDAPNALLQGYASLACLAGNAMPDWFGTRIVSGGFETANGIATAFCKWEEDSHPFDRPAPEVRNRYFGDLMDRWRRERGRDSAWFIGAICAMTMPEHLEQTVGLLVRTFASPQTDHQAAAVAGGRCLRRRLGPEVLEALRTALGGQADRYLRLLARSS